MTGIHPNPIISQPNSNNNNNNNQSQLNQSTTTNTITNTYQFVPNTDHFQSLNIYGNVFDITQQYTDLQPIGMGAFGLVCSAWNSHLHQPVAIKKILKPFTNLVLAKRTCRELKLLRHIFHDNVIHLMDVFVSPADDMYFVTDLLDTDLHRLLLSRSLDSQFIQYFMYQIMRGLKYIHSSGVIHRDLKPSNVLINENCDLKICDFGLARMDDPQMTGYVSTRYYRAPEIMLSWQKYDRAVDIWSVGCIFAELLTGKPLFPGKDHVHQFSIITELLGSPPDNLMSTICSENTLKFVKSLPPRQPKPFSQVFPGIDPLALDLLSKMLVFDSNQRITATQVLDHPYLAVYHDVEDEPESLAPFDWSFADAELSLDQWRDLTVKEVIDFHLHHHSSGSLSSSFPSVVNNNDAE